MVAALLAGLSVVKVPALLAGTGLDPPVPTATPAPTPDPETPAAASSPTLIRFIPFANLKEKLIESLNARLLDAVEGILELAAEAVSATLFHTPLLDEHPRLVELWGRARAVAAAMLILPATVAGVLLMTASTFDWHYPARQLLSRLLAAAPSLRPGSSAAMSRTCASAARIGTRRGPARLLLSAGRSEPRGTEPAYP